MTEELYIKTSATSTIDGNEKGWVDAYTVWGVSFTDASLSLLMAPVPVKPPVENKSRLMHGKKVVTNGTYTRKEERELTLEMHIKAANKTVFWQRYYAFCQQVLDAQFIDIKSGYIPQQNGHDVVFHMTYESCTQFSEFIQEMAKFSLRLNEPNPDNRT